MSYPKSIKKHLSSAKNAVFHSPWWLKVIALVVIMGVGWLGLPKLFSAKSATPQYQTTTAEKGTLVIATTSSGQVSSANSGSITTQASGVVKTIFVKNGDTVKSGSKIAELELDQTAKQKYVQASASYQSAKNNVANAQATLYSLQSKMFVANQQFINDAVSRGLVSGDPTYIEQNADWLAAEAGYKNQQNVIAAAQTSLNSAAMSLQQSSPIIYAPISGTVTGMSLQPGSVLTSGTSSSDSTTPTSQKVASIQTTAAPTITVNLSEVDVTKVKVGNKATITIDALTDKSFTGKVVSIDTIGAINSGVTTYPAVIALDTQNDQIFSNMTAQVNIITNTKTDVLLVPSSAVKTQNGQSMVQVLKNGQPQSVTVETGLSSDTQTEVTSGLNEGDEVVTSTTAATTIRTTGTQTQSVFSTLGGANRGGAATGARQVQFIAR